MRASFPILTLALSAAIAASAGARARGESSRGEERFAGQAEKVWTVEDDSPPDVLVDGLDDAIPAGYESDSGFSACDECAVKFDGGFSGRVCGSGNCRRGCAGPWDHAACCFGGWADKVFAGVEYLHWWNKGRHLPPLVAVRPSLADPFETIYGDEAIGGDLQAGGRITFGWWLDDCRSKAFGVKAYGVEGSNSGFFRANPTTDFVLGVPYIDADTLAPEFFNARSNGEPGTIRTWSENEIYGTQIFLRSLLDAGADYRVDMLAGYQWARINDDLQLDVLSHIGQSTLQTRDLFETTNTYNAGELGLLGEWFVQRWTISLLGKIGYGTMRQTSRIGGEFGFLGPPAPPTGFFARPSNIGYRTRNVTAWSPEASVKASYGLTDKLSISVGYTFLYWTNVVLAGDEVNPVMTEPVLVSSGPEPTFAWNDTDFWVQTIDIGVNFNY